MQKNPFKKKLCGERGLYRGVGGRSALHTPSLLNGCSHARVFAQTFVCLYCAAVLRGCALWSCAAAGLLCCRVAAVGGGLSIDYPAGWPAAMLLVLVVLHLVRCCHRLPGPALELGPWYWSPAPTIARLR